MCIRDSDSIAARVKRSRGAGGEVHKGGARLVLSLRRKKARHYWKAEREVHFRADDGCWSLVGQPRSVISQRAQVKLDFRKFLPPKPTSSASNLHPDVVVVPVKHLSLRKVKYDVAFKEGALWAVFAMHKILSRMVMFHCTTCNERFSTCHPAYRPPDDLDLELLGRPKTNKGRALAPCCVDVATWDEVPPFKESEEELLVAREYTGCCLGCYRDVQRELERLRKIDSTVQESDVIPLRGWQNRMDPCFRFPHEELGDLFRSLTVTEARFVALEHMQIDFVTVRRTGLRKFRKNMISFPQSPGKLFHRLGMLKQYRIGERVNSTRGPGGDLDRPARLSRVASEEEQKAFATDKEGRLVFPGTVTRLEGVEIVYVKYDHTGDEEFRERAEGLTPRLQMPWHPQLLQGQYVIRLTQNVRHGDPIEGLEVRWGPVCQVLRALTALPHLYPRVTNGLPWRFGGRMDEPMHRWYDPKLGMFDVLDEEDVRKRYAPKVIEGEVISREDAVRDYGAAAADFPGCDLRTAEDMLAAGLDVRLDVGLAEGLSLIHI